MQSFSPFINRFERHRFLFDLILFQTRHLIVTARSYLSLDLFAVLSRVFDVFEDLFQGLRGHGQIVISAAGFELTRAVVILVIEIFTTRPHGILGFCHSELISSSLIVLGHRFDQMSLLLFDLVPLLRTIRCLIKSRIKVL